MVTILALLLLLALARLIHLEMLTRRSRARFRALAQSSDDAVVLIDSNAVHELRTPLTTAKGFIELIAGGDAGPVTDTQREFLEIAARSTDRLGVLIDDLVGRSGRGS